MTPPQFSPNSALGSARPGGLGFRVVPFSSARRVIIDYLAVARHQHVVHALVEVDVTLPPHLLREPR